MRNKMLLIIGAMLFIMGQVGVNYLIYKEKNNVVIPKVKLKSQENKKDTFAIMLEQDNGTYKSSESTSFNQSGYTFNSEKSGCIDINGNKIENSLSYNDTTKAVVVNVNSTSYCYVYFDLKPNDGATQLIESEELWESGLEGDGYRYTGTNPDNYICFGTTNKDTCVGNTDAYMYRIIGVFPDSEGNQHMKLIKKEALNAAMEYYPNSHFVVESEDDSLLYEKLNDTKTGSAVYLKNSTYMPADGTKNWSDRITSWKWSIVDTGTYWGDPDYSSMTTKQIYLHELNRSGRPSGGEWTTSSRKIGLMYASDYALSLGNGALNYTSSSNAATLKTGWMHLSNNDSSAPNTREWTSAYFGCDEYDLNRMWAIIAGGDIGFEYIASKISARPTFYLNTD